MTRLILSLAMTLCVTASDARGIRSTPYDTCIKRAQGVHPEMMKCMSRAYETQVEDVAALLKLSETGELGKVSTQMSSQGELWQKFVTSKCDVYLGIGGQRGELLAQNCKLDEAKRRKAYVKNVLAAAEI